MNYVVILDDRYVFKFKSLDSAQAFVGIIGESIEGNIGGHEDRLSCRIMSESMFYVWLKDEGYETRKG